MNLRHLRFKLPASQAIPEQLFEAIRGIFRETPVMIIRGPFPGRQPRLGAGHQRLGARMIGRPRHRLRPGRHHQVRPGGLVNLAGVVRPIGIDLGDRIIDLLMIFKNLIRYL